MKTLKLSMILLLGRHSFTSNAPFHTYWNIFARFCIQRFLKLTVYSIGLYIANFYASSIKQPRQYIQYFKSLQHSSCQIQYSTKQIQYGFHNIQTAKLLLVIIYDTVYTVQYCAAMVPKVCSTVLVSLWALENGKILEAKGGSSGVQQSKQKKWTEND